MNPSTKVTIKGFSKQQGFTLIELIVVIVLLGVTSVGIAQILSLGTQSYVNSVERDQLMNSARFGIERLNREISAALPNSVRSFSVSDNGSNVECIEFVPILASSTYLDFTNLATNQFNVVEFNDAQGNLGTCTESCGNVAIYTLSNDDVYVDPEQTSGQLFSVDEITLTATDNLLQVTLNNNVTVEALSPTDRVFFINQPVRYCMNNSTNELFRLTGYDIATDLTVSVSPNNLTGTLMAENIIDANFNIQSASLTRNAIVLVDLTFQSNIDSSEVIPFSQEIAILNTP